MSISEAQFQRTVIELARLRGWAVYHTHDSRHSEAGFPDLVMARMDRLIFAELKRDGEGPSPYQALWLELLQATPAETFLWHPADWVEIEETLR